MNKSDVIIDLHESRDAKPVSLGKLIQQDEYNRVKSFVSDSLQLVKRVNINTRIPKTAYLHNTITILGTRGSGKSTFLLSIMEYYKQNKSDFCVIDMIDPTAIEEKGHIFLTIVASIRDLVYQKRKEGGLTKRESLSKFESWKESLNRLSQALPSIDGVGNDLLDSNWQDPDYILERGLESVSAALKLREDFTEFIRLSLIQLEARCLMIAFDDIDIDFKRGWPVLETIRKYFVSPQIISFLSGDLRLYSKSIRKQHWLNFGKELLRNESTDYEKQNYFKMLVTEMEGQYLMKILKPDRRINLSTLGDLINRNKGFGGKRTFNIMIKKGSDKPIEVFRAYQVLLRKFGIVNQYQAETYISYLLRLPLRTQIQFHLKSTEFIEGENYHILDPFLSDLIEKRIDVINIAGSAVLVNVEILKLLLKEQMLQDLYQLQPITADESLNGSLMTLTMLSSKNFAQTSFFMFEFIIKVVWVRNLVSLLNYRSENTRAITKSIGSIEGLVANTGILQDRVLRDTVGHIHAYLSGALSSGDRWGGAINIPAFGRTRKQGQSAISGRIDIVFRAHPLKRLIAYMPITVNSDAITSRSSVCYSIFTLIACIGECVRRNSIDDLKSGLSELGQIRTYPVPNLNRDYDGTAERSGSLFSDEEIMIANTSKLCKAIDEWNKKYVSVGRISPHLLGKAITRFYYSLKNIQEQESDTRLGEKMHRRVVAFLNSLLIEEHREFDSSSERVNFANTVISDRFFVRNISYVAKHQKSSEIFSFFLWMISCPLLLSFIDPKSALYKNIGQLNSRVDNTLALDLNVYSLLNRIEVKVDNVSEKTGGNFERRSHLNNDELVIFFKEKKVPFELFKQGTKKQSTRLNNIIRTELKDLPGYEDWSSLSIRNFRKYLSKNRIRW